MGFSFVYVMQLDVNIVKMINFEQLPVIQEEFSFEEVLHLQSFMKKKKNCKSTLSISTHQLVKQLYRWQPRPKCTKKMTCYGCDAEPSPRNIQRIFVCAFVPALKSNYTSSDDFPKYNITINLRPNLWIYEPKTIECFQWVRSV